MKIAIDIDETVLEFSEAFFAFYKKHHDSNFNYSQDKISTYWFEDILGVDSNRVQQLFSEFKKTPFFRDMPSVKGAKEAISQLSKKNELFFITARPIDLSAETRIQINSLFTKHNFQIIHSHDNNNKKIKEKAEFCKELKIKTIIEDDLNIALECAKEGLICFLIDKPWNKNHEDPKNIIRVKNWSEIMRHLT